MIGDNNFIEDIKIKEEVIKTSVVKGKKSSMFLKLFAVFCFFFFLYFVIHNIENKNTRLSFKELVEDSCINTNFSIYQIDENWLDIRYEGMTVAEMKYYDDAKYLNYAAKKLGASNASIRKLHPLPEVNEVLEELGMHDRLMSYETFNHYLILYRADIDDYLKMQLQDIYEKVKDKKLLQKGIIIEDMSSQYDSDISEYVKDLFEEKNREILIELVLNQGTVSERERLYSIFSKVDCFHEKCEIWKQCNDLIDKKKWDSSQLKKEITDELKTQVFTLGEYEVGKDLLPGIYVCIDENYENEDAFHAKKMSFSLKKEVYQKWYQDIIVVLENGDNISVNGHTKLYHLDNTPKLQTTRYPRGVFYVGKHISEGKYEVEALSNYYPCYYWIVDSSKINELLSMSEEELQSKQKEYNGHIIEKGKNGLLTLNKDKILVLMDGKLKKK